MATFKQSFEPKLTYVYRINDEAHKGVLKIGEASYEGDDFLTVQPNAKSLNEAAKIRIRHQTQTAGVQFELLHTETNLFYKNKSLHCFQDHEVRDVLERSGIKHKYFDEKHKANEWFYTDLETAKKAIAAVKEGRKSLNATEISTEKNPIILRPEQREAVEKTIKHFAKKHSSNQMLWNAKMRFGKTLSALQLIKELDFRRTLILTHRPVVDEGWYEDFIKTFNISDRPEFVYSSKNKGTTLEDAEKIYNSSGTGSYIYFASIQDLRGSKDVGGTFDKNEEVFNINWNFIIIDEAHEGTQTELGQKVLKICRKKDTKVLHLSGTPFNLMNDFEEEEIFTWDYVMEQKAKADWDILHQGDPNPYACLPKLNIFTYNLGKLFTEYADEDYAFNFREFFKVDNNGNFVHKENIIQFLNLLTKEDSQSNYPFSTKEFRENFRHSLWMIPGVKEAKALSAVLQEHPIFDQYKIINVAGDGDEEIDSKDALKAVQDAMSDKPEETYTITLSCGRLTTGVSVKPWTACFMLAGSYNTAASTYMQTIFRVQTPAIIGGKVKTECFVFDFAPDRTLKVIAETAKISSKAGKTSGSDRKILGQFLNFCPIIGFEGSKMMSYDTEKMLEQLKKVYVERVVQNGFEDTHLYNDDLMRLDKLELEQFNDLKEIIGTTKAMKKTGDIVVNDLGFTDEDFGNQIPEKVENGSKKTELTPEQQAALEKLKEQKKNRDAAISILRGISIRMPLLIYGAELQKNLDGSEQDITIDNFADVIDEESWKEFMPQGVTKEKFSEFVKYYDKDIFHSAGVKIRQIAKVADNFTIEERIERIGFIFNSFRNPDKETVLTPWRVVNMHLNDCLGGYTFFDEKFEKTITEPRFTEQNNVTKEIFNKNTKILEINSKTGLYALYCAYSVYKMRLKQELGPNATKEQQKQLWNKVISENIYVICKTKMAKAITRRTLAGFTDAKINAHYFEDLVNSLKNESDKFVEKVTSGKCWHKENTKMEFDAVVGNPPYQDMGGSGGNNDAPIYQHFSETAFKLIEKQSNGFVSLIMPSRWFAAGRENLLGEFRKKMLNCGKISLLTNFANGNEVFTNVEIKGGICYFLYNNSYLGKCDYKYKNGKEIQEIQTELNKFDILIREPQLIPIIEKVEKIRKEKNISTVDTIISADTPFGIPSNPRNSSKTPFNVYTTSSSEHNVLLYHIEKLKRKIEYCSEDEIIKNKKDISKFKVFIPGAGGSGNDSVVLGRPEFAPSNSVCSQSYLYAAFETEIEAKNFIKYIKTLFFRIIVAAIKITQSAPNRVYKFVPLQDFTTNSDIDWSVPIPQIDAQLYKKYNLTPEEIAFIEKMVKPME